ncbi:MAG: type II toxin-antitoxin system PrlF family antitoxin [Gemmatimonadetes bacterium]|nr:type II toxin-antitoxin system PrlF family antitoxin [Gemmatimonadota bacterium]
MNRVQPDPEEDPTLLAFLDLLERDIEEDPERLVPVTRELIDRMRALTAGIPVDLDEPIEGDRVAARTARCTS